MADVNISGIFDSVGVAENVDTELSDLSPNVYDSVSVAEWAYVVSKPWVLNETIAAWKLSARFTDTFQLDARLPAWEFSGQTGYRLNEKLPVAELSATMSEGSIGISVNSKLPTWSVEGQTGFRMSSYIPVGEVSGSFDMTYILSLSEKIPLLTFTGTMYEEGTFSLNGYIPVRTLSAILDISAESITVSSYIPGALKLTASMYVSSGFELSEKMPVRSLEATMYSGSYTVSSYLPAWSLDASMLETKPDVHHDSDVSDDSFAGVLRYVRP